MRIKKITAYIAAVMLAVLFAGAFADMGKVRISFTNDCFPNEKLRCNGVGQLVGSLILTSP